MVDGGGGSKFLAPNFDPESEECKRKRDQVSRGSGPGEAVALPAPG